jgi:hypothetical protein
MRKAKLSRGSKQRGLLDAFVLLDAGTGQDEVSHGVRDDDAVRRLNLDRAVVVRVLQAGDVPAVSVSVEVGVLKGGADALRVRCSAVAGRSRKCARLTASSFWMFVPQYWQRGLQSPGVLTLANWLGPWFPTPCRKTQRRLRGAWQL